MSPPDLAGQVRRLQRHLQSLYALEIGYDATDFVVDSAARARLAEALGGAPSHDREALWLLEEDGEMSVALCLDDELHGATALDDAALDRYCALLEGVSHLLYVLDRARDQRPLTLLEMELQAEVDKFVTTWFARQDAQVPTSPTGLHRRLFRDFSIPPRACADETARYRAANRLASRYCRHLHQRFLAPDRVQQLLPEVRRFWRMGHAEKIAHIESC